MTTRVIASKAVAARDRVLHLIRKGKYAPGAKLPSELELAKELGMDTQSVRRGLAELKESGLIVNRHRVGNFVRQATPRELTTSIALIVPYYMIENADGTARRHPLVQSAIGAISRSFDSASLVSQILSYRTAEDLQLQVVPMLIERQIHGVILWSDSSDVDQPVAQLVRKDIPLVLLQETPLQSRLGLVTVSEDQERAISQIAHGLAERGHRKVLWADYQRRKDLDHLIHVRDVHAREAGIAVAKPYQRILVDNPIGAPMNFTSLFDALEKWKPTAVVVPDECISSQVFRWCYQRHIGVPDQLSIVAKIDCTPDIHPVPLTAPDTLGIQASITRLAAESLRKLIAGEELIQRKIVVDAPIIWKASVRSLIAPASPHTENPLET